MRFMMLELRDTEFEKISQLVYSHCGIHLHDGKKELVKARLSKRIREGNFPSFADYYDYVKTGDGTDEFIAMIDSLSTNLTSFFREDGHFRALSRIVPALLREESRRSKPRLRFWSAGCSTGEEPYTIAITALEASHGLNAELQILATDISTKVLKKAEQSIYHADRVKAIPPDLLKKYFQIGQGNWAGHYRLKKDVRSLVSFQRFNLMDPMAAGDPFDAIFCRNVMIYFDKKTQEGLVNRFYNKLAKGGYLFIGHSESLTGLNHAFKYLEPSLYRK
jgi:chemotaxis protein methyltransferase CheR